MSKDKIFADKLRLSDLLKHYKYMYDTYGDMELVVLHIEHKDEDGWWIEDNYETVDSHYIGYPKEVYLYDGEYSTDLPYEYQKTNKKMVYVIDEA